MMYSVNFFKATGAVSMRSLKACAAVVVACGGLGVTLGAAAQDKYMGELMLTGATFCPNGTWEANGQLMPVNQNGAMYSLYGTLYGGDGVNTFGLPDLRGRVPVGVGPSTTGFQAVMGEVGGSETVTLSTNQLPAHTHALSVGNQPATSGTPAQGQMLAQTQNAGTYASGTPNVQLSAASVGATGGNTPIPVRNPYVGMRWCVVYNGIYPSRP